MLYLSAVAEKLSAYFVVSSTEKVYSQPDAVAVGLGVEHPALACSLRRVTLQSPLALAFPRFFPATTTNCSALHHLTMSDSESEAFDLSGVSGGSDSEGFILPTKKVG
jgi:hypothetical protein